MFNKSLLDNPKFTPIDKMESVICGPKDPGTSYDYLLSVGPMQQLKSARDNRAKKINDLKEHYKYINGDDIIKTTWLKELKELNAVIIKGTTSERGWLYGERKSKWN